MRSSPQHGLQNTALFHMTSSVGPKTVPAPGHGHMARGEVGMEEGFHAMGGYWSFLG